MPRENSNEQRQDAGGNDQLQGGREALAHLVDDRAVPSHQRIPEIQCDHILQETPILHDQGFIQAQVFPGRARSSRGSLWDPGLKTPDRLAEHA